MEIAERDVLEVRESMEELGEEMGRWVRDN